MNKVLILGASGAIAQHTIEKLQKDGNVELTLFARNSKSIKQFANAQTKIVEGDVLNENDLNEAVKGQNIIYANLAGSVDKMAEAIVKAMDKNNVKRLIFVTSLGIYDEVPGKFGEWNNRMIGSALKTYRKAADVIEASDLDYTVVRPAWLQDDDEVDYETTQKSEPFKGTEVSRKAVGSYIADIIEHPEKDSKASVGLNKPGTDGNKPSFY
ncbi:MAG: SDR family oxidoreductase [Mangrovibacterium sp.]